MIFSNVSIILEVETGYRMEEVYCFVMVLEMYGSPKMLVIRIYLSVYVCKRYKDTSQRER